MRKYMIASHIIIAYYRHSNKRGWQTYFLVNDPRSLFGNLNLGTDKIIL